MQLDCPTSITDEVNGIPFFEAQTAPAFNLTCCKLLANNILLLAVAGEAMDDSFLASWGIELNPAWRFDIVPLLEMATKKDQAADLRWRAKNLFELALGHAHSDGIRPFCRGSLRTGQ